MACAERDPCGTAGEGARRENIVRSIRQFRGPYPSGRQELSGMESQG
jgi:hypothetical protein